MSCMLIDKTLFHMIHPKKWQGKKFHMIATLMVHTAQKVQGNEGECNYSICQM
jgi:hypothetical protein